MVKLAPSEELTEDLFALFSEYQSSDITLQAFPMVANAILWDRENKAIINEVLLLAVGTCIHLRTGVVSVSETTSELLNRKMEPLSAAIAKTSDRARRNAVILEAMRRLLCLADCSETWDRLG